MWHAGRRGFRPRAGELRPGERGRFDRGHKRRAPPAAAGRLGAAACCMNRAADRNGFRWAVGAVRTGEHAAGRTGRHGGGPAPPAPPAAPTDIWRKHLGPHCLVWAAIAPACVQHAALYTPLDFLHLCKRHGLLQAACAPSTLDRLALDLKHGRPPCCLRGWGCGIGSGVRARPCCSTRHAHSSGCEAGRIGAALLWPES